MQQLLREADEEIIPAASHKSGKGKNTNHGRKEKATKAAIICYSFGDIASQFVWTFVGSYLTIFYTDIVGLAPAAVSAIMMVARIWDPSL